MPPYLSKTAPWFAFLVHPRNTQDLLNFDAGRLLRDYCSDLEDFERRLCSMPPFVAGEVFFGMSQLKGEIIAVMRMPEMLMSKTGREAIKQGVTLATKRGARVLGLGGLTSPATLGGKWLLEDLMAGVVLTNGNAYTAAVVHRNVQDASRQMLLGLKAVVAVVGCTGSVGSAASELLAEDGYRLFLVGRSFASVEKRFPRLPKGAQIVDLEIAVSQADIVVLLTNDPTSSLRPCTARAGTFIIDCAQPANLSELVRQKLRGEGVVVVDGGLVRIPNYECTYDFNLHEVGTTFSCLAETYLFARNGLKSHSVGHPPIGLSRKLEKLAEQSEIKIRPLKSAGIQTDAQSSIQTVAS